MHMFNLSNFLFFSVGSSAVAGSVTATRTAATMTAIIITRKAAAVSSLEQTPSLKLKSNLVF